MCVKLDEVYWRTTNGCINLETVNWKTTDFIGEPPPGV